MKDMHKRKPIDKFVGLKSKMHSMLLDNGKESNTAKGVNIATEFKEYEDTLINKKIIRHKTRRIQSKKHKIGTYEVNKISLSCFDDKRCILDESIHTIAYFHKDFEKVHFNKKKGSYRFSHRKRDTKRFPSVLTNKNKYIWIKVTHAHKKLGDKLDRRVEGGRGYTLVVK